MKGYYVDMDYTLAVYDDFNEEDFLLQCAFRKLDDAKKYAIVKLEQEEDVIQAELLDIQNKISKVIGATDKQLEEEML